MRTNFQIGEIRLARRLDLKSFKMVVLFHIVLFHERTRPRPQDSMHDHPCILYSQLILFRAFQAVFSLFLLHQELALFCHFEVVSRVV